MNRSSISRASASRRRPGMGGHRGQRLLAQRRFLGGAGGAAGAKACGEQDKRDKGGGPRTHAASLARRNPAWQRPKHARADRASGSCCCSGSASFSPRPGSPGAKGCAAPARRAPPMARGSPARAASSPAAASRIAPRTSSPGWSWCASARIRRRQSVTAAIPLIASDTATYREGYGCLLEEWQG